MKIAAVQMVSSTQVDANLAQARAWIDEAAKGGAHLIALPENFCFMGHTDHDKLAIAEAPGRGPIQAMLSNAAREHRVWLIGGSLPMSTNDPNQATNTCLVFAPSGTLAARHDKLHLFRYDNGRENYDEGRTLRAGDAPVTVDVDNCRVGLSICYDLRFPELYRRMMSPPCDVLSVPSAFTYTTGRAHWELLLRARAVENQCYVIAPAQGGKHENGRQTWGHTMIVDPWGEVVAVQPEGAGVVTAEIDTERIARVRAQLPALPHRRL